MFARIWAALCLHAKRDCCAKWKDEMLSTFGLASTAPTSTSSILLAKSESQSRAKALKLQNSIWKLKQFSELLLPLLLVECATCSHFSVFGNGMSWVSCSIMAFYVCCILIPRAYMKMFLLPNSEKHARAMPENSKIEIETHSGQ